MGGVGVFKATKEAVNKRKAHKSTRTSSMWIHVKNLWIQTYYVATQRLGCSHTTVKSPVVALAPPLNRCGALCRCPGVSTPDLRTKPELRIFVEKTAT